jgi:hypothetical protein
MYCLVCNKLLVSDASVCSNCGANQTEELQKLMTIAKQNNVGENFLDEYVHDCASSLASDANNEGVPGQLKFLLTHWGSDAVKEIRRILTEESGAANS